MAETIGLDIGSHSIKLVGLKMTLKGPVITHAGIKEIPYGEDREDLDFISEIVKSLYREIGLQPGKVSLTVSGSGVFIRQITIPSIPKAELREAVRCAIKEYLPFPVESAPMNFFILHEFIEDNVKKLDVIVVACPKNLIDRTLSITEGAGLKPVHLDICPFAIWNAMLISGQLAIKQEMDIFSKTPHEKIGDKSIDFSKISFLVRPVIERLTVEIGRSLDYYKSQFHVERIDRLLLTGGGSNLIDIASCLSGELRLPVEQFIPFRRILFDSKKIDPQVAQLLEPMSALFTVATGIALPETKQIELLPVKPPYWSSARMEKLIPIFSTIVTLIVFLWIFLQMSGQMSVIKKEYDEKMTKVKTLEALQAELIVLKDKENRMKQDLSLIPSSVIIQVPFQEALLEVGRIVPDNVTVTLLLVQGGSDTSKKETQTKEGKELQIKGIAFGSDLQCLTALAQIIDRLENSPLFKNARLVTADENKLYNQPATEFEIVCDIEG